MTRALVAAAVVLAMAPAAAGAHSTVVIQGADILYTSEDAISDNALTVDESATSIRFRDPEADAGITGPSQCTAGDFRNGVSYELTCPKTGLQRLTVDLGPNEDRMVAGMQAITVGAVGAAGADRLQVAGPLGDLLAGDSGNDTLDGGDGGDDLRGDEGNDTITGGGGNDTIQAGPGADAVDAGEGDDTVLVPDGSVDRVTCGPGADTVRADTIDEVAADCESVERQYVAPPSGGSAGDDTTKPVLKAGAAVRQRISRRRRVLRIAATLSEVGEISASGYLFAGGINTPISTRSYRVRVAGGGVTIKARLSRSQVRRALRSMRRGRRAYARIHVVGSDAAGNSTVHRPIKIRLRR